MGSIINGKDDAARLEEIQRQMLNEQRESSLQTKKRFWLAFGLSIVAVVISTIALIRSW